MFKYIFNLILATTVIACSPASPTKTVVVTPSSAKQKPKTEVQPSNSNVTWSLDVPSDWTKETRPDPTSLNDVRRVLKATKVFKVENEEVQAILTVTVGHLSANESSHFSTNILEIEQSRENAKVLDSKPVMLGKTPGVELIEVRQLDPHTLVALLVEAGSKNDTCVLVACGSLVEVAEEVLPECNKILETLVIK
jgi:hypothetical protein